MENELIKILYIDDEKAALFNFKQLFQDDFEVYTALSAAKAMEILEATDIQIIVSDQRMPDKTGIEFFAEVAQLCPDTLRILLTAYSEAADIIDAINRGQVYQYITKPFETRNVKNILDKATQHWRLKKENELLIAQLQNKNEKYEAINEELRQTNEELRASNKNTEESKNQTKEILQTAMDGFWMVDLKGKFIEVNEVACKMLGYSRTEMLKFSISDLEIVETAEQTKKHLQKVFEIGEDRFEKKHRCKNGEIIDVELSVKFQSDQNLFMVFVRDITNRKLDEEALKRSTQLLSETEKIGKVGGWEINIDTMDTTWTDGVYNIQEVELNSNQNVEKGINFYAPESRSVISKAVQRAIEFGEPFDLELEIITAKGNRRNVHAIGKADLKHRRVYGFFQDITDRKLSEAALRKSEARFRAWFELPLIGICITSPTKGWLEANDHLYNMLGYGRDELFKLNWADLTHPEDLAADNAQFLRVIDGQIEGYSLEKRFLRKDGSTFHSELAVRCVRGVEGHVDYFVALIQDITERKQAEQKILESQAKLSEALETSIQSRKSLLSVLEDQRLADREIQKLNAELEQRVKTRTALLEAANKELETFTYSVSHDLKAPLRGIDGYSKLLLDIYSKDLNEEAKAFISTIRSSTMQMNQLIEDLLEYSRLERSQMRSEKIIIKGLISSIISVYKNELNAGKYILEIDVQNIELTADTKGLTIALRNILENAIKFTKGKANPAIEIGLEEKTDSWILRIKDNGIGFDMKYHQRIFEIFQRLHRAEDFQGTGIGLAMVSKAMLRMGGKVWAESTPGIGSTFYLEIPKTN